MSQIRGIFPLFLATAFGIGNGIWVFGPAFKEQQREKQEQAQKALEVARHSEAGEVQTLREAEAAASRKIATESALRADNPSKSWWPSLSLWSKETKAGIGKSDDTTPTKGNDMEKEN
ncbi:hypothetical protein M430DRAFT_27080 [Amorphotheca resinae ATCC 22711]|uniref:Uncharacterized protein n=1 Tax=Amorphotheca resinae ATCC 22711 TaxID=857342 RepID=A0A2T3B2W6_AMORE|nr:hypothetical protein M430DRAFT_27080 [Amorphotheca resinae ATCC 22711]PSS19983.1 hypothetical protein M430DRAFT_27080 [Amorphotheca resinae ATCC 22711]